MPEHVLVNVVYCGTTASRWTVLAGKTLALLCASLAWQQQQAQSAAHKPDAAVPRIFWAARTHAQIDHAVHEVRWVINSYRTTGLALVMVTHGQHCLHLVLVGASSQDCHCLLSN